MAESYDVIVTGTGALTAMADAVPAGGHLPARLS
jgi:hypothetical protein